MATVPPPYLITTGDGRFWSLTSETKVIPTLRGCWGWFKGYRNRIGLMKSSRIFLALVCKSLTHSLQESLSHTR